MTVGTILTNGTESTLASASHSSSSISSSSSAYSLSQQCGKSNTVEIEEASNSGNSFEDRSPPSFSTGSYDGLEEKIREVSSDFSFTPETEFVSVTIWEFRFRTLYFYAFGAPILAYCFALLTGYLVDHEHIINYATHCGKVFMPSFSRIINLPKERMIFNFLVLTHACLRPAVVLINYRKCFFYHPLLLVTNSIGWVSKHIMFWGTFEVIFVICLTITGEREEDTVHVWFYAGYATCGATYSIMTTVVFYRNPNVSKLSFILKLILSSSFLLMQPVITSLYFVFQKGCVINAYNIFAPLEYATILMNFLYHGTVVLDCDDLFQVKATVRYSRQASKPPSYTEINNNTNDHFTDSDVLDIPQKSLKSSNVYFSSSAFLLSNEPEYILTLPIYSNNNEEKAVNANLEDFQKLSVIKPGTPSIAIPKKPSSKPKLCDSLNTYL